MVLVTGGLGYLGGVICEFLVNSGEQVRIGTSRKNAHIPEKLRSCEVVVMDFASHNSLNLACNGVDSIVHLAALNAKDSSSDPEQALLINGLGTLNLLNTAIKHKVDRFLYFSTIHVYGFPSSSIVYESTLPEPTSHYSITHKLAEFYILKEVYKNNINGSIFRISNVVGAPLSHKTNCWTLIANDLCKQAIVNQSIELRSSKEITRDFIGISNLCKSVHFYLNIKKSFSKINGEVFNLTSGIPTSLENLASIIALRAEQRFGYKVKIKYNKQEERKESLIFSNQKAKNIGFDLKVNLESEIDILLLKCKIWFNS